MLQRIVFMIGPPACGKGTQAKRLAKELGYVYVEVSELIRAYKRAHQETASTTTDLMAKGDLVNDELVINLVRQKLAEHPGAEGFVVDGLPRTIAQAVFIVEVLGFLYEIIVIRFDLPDEDCVERARIRLEVELKKPEAERDIRPDDNPVTHRDRLVKYRHADVVIFEYFDDRIPDEFVTLSTKAHPDIIFAVVREAVFVPV